MSFYPLLRPLLFCLKPETSHHFTLWSLDLAHRLRLLSCCAAAKEVAPRTIMGLEFPNPVGLAAGLDKNGEHIDALAALGFGFIEIGTVTPRPQPGNPRPRMFRVTKANAIINGMGFNNNGVDQLVENVKRAKYKGILGINIGKNSDTPIERAADDYLICLREVYALASYITVNISSPNTPRLRQLQSPQELDKLLGALKTAQRELAQTHQKYVPIAVKIAPDLEADEISEIAQALLRHKIDAVIATNTTLDREGITDHRYYQESGGLSGLPLKDKSTNVVRELNKSLLGCIPIIAVGGIMNANDAKEKIEAGASLIQIYTGLIYAGPSLVKEAVDSTSDR